VQSYEKNIFFFVFLSFIRIFAASTFKEYSNEKGKLLADSRDSTDADGMYGHDRQSRDAAKPRTIRRTDSLHSQASTREP
jgi:hypothetical protein